jgi:glyoxylase-like metal-dependent hydrolase (beta-lactamase superfamily II)
MRLQLGGVLALFTALSLPAAAQNATEVLAAASRAMGVENLRSMTYSGTARNGQFGQSKSIGNPMGPTNVTAVTAYTRTVSFEQAADAAALVSRATGPTLPPALAGVPPQPAGVFSQNISSQQARTSWAQALNIWTTPWGFVKAAAAASDASVRRAGRQQVISFSPANFTSPSGQRYTVTGYLDSQNRVSKVETRVEHTVLGDLPVAFEYSNYQSMNGVQVPTRIVQTQAGMRTFDANITAGTPNPPNLAELLSAPAAQAPGGGPQPPPGPPGVDRLGEGVFKIGGNYTSLAVDMGDHILVVESGQSDARGMAVMAAAKQAIPGKPIRFVVNTHPHFDHASGLAAAVAEGATILTHRNNEPVLEKLLAGPRTLGGDSLSKVTKPRRNVVQAVGDRDVRRGTNGKVVELHRIAIEHSDGMLVVYLPAERALYTADLTVINPNPVQLGNLRPAVQAFNRLNLDYETWIPAHLPSPLRPLTRADVMAAVGNN